MDITQAVKYLYPKSRARVDYEVYDDADGKGPRLADWKVKNSSGVVVPIPTMDTLNQAYLDSLVPVQAKKDLEASDKEMVRTLEDLIDALILKGVIKISDLGIYSENRISKRKEDRSKL